MQLNAVPKPDPSKLAAKRAEVKTTTPMITHLFMTWKKNKVAGMSAQRAERAKNDRMSGSELFLSDASLFVDDAEAYEKYQREEEPDNTTQKFTFHGLKEIVRIVHGATHIQQKRKL